ncbi:MAG: hypothetical protein JWQ38_1257 [Flavipsychrobacter sp.]|nr:hypothetical protein [Flavipsychrobacter sp.]
MAKKRKISIRKILQLFVTLVVTVCCVVAMVSASKIENNKMLTSVAVHIRNDKKYHFVEQQEIIDLAINQKNIDVTHTPLSKLDIHGMEQVILADPWIADAQVYVDNERVLQMYVTQRIPVVRVFQQNTASYYIDTTLSIMPLSANYIYYTTVVTNVPEIKNDSMGWAMRKDIVALVRHIQSDSFWSAQISQVIVDSADMFELVPMIGNQRILFGDAENMKEKFSNLFAFYKNVLNHIGWDKYETLDVRYKGQVVALPSLPYKGPVDKAITNMNWINSIVETEAANDTRDSVNTAAAKVQQVVAEKKKEVAKPVLHAKPVIKSKTVVKTKDKFALKSNKEKGKKKAAPKYVYPDKKGH